MPRFSTPILVGTVFVAAVLVAGCAGTAAAPAASTPPAGHPAAGPNRAEIHLAVKGGPAEGNYDSTPESPLATCVQSPDGTRRVQYAGAHTTMEVIVGSQAGEPGHASDVALEMDSDSGYFWIDQAGIRVAGRGTDPAGRSTITADVRKGDGSTTIVIDATTPYKSGYDDSGKAHISATIVCPA
jgi:hypothetical protein